ncbi:MAG: copper-binding protein [Acidobacteriota bacterium]|nr:copper-binding protein [Acidobacteriota bacterium]
MSKRYWLALAACCTVLACGVAKKKEPARIYKFHGTVIRLDPASNVAAIHNEKVAGWMDPMTMEYPIESASEFKSLRPGERIAAEVNVTTDGFFLTGVHEDPPK